MAYQKRWVIGYVYDANNQPVTNGQVKFKLDDILSFTDTHAVNNRDFFATTDTDTVADDDIVLAQEPGKFRVELWCDDTGLKSVDYIPMFPAANGGQAILVLDRKLSLAYDDGSPIYFGTALVNSENPGNIADSVTLADVIDQRININSVRTDIDQDLLDAQKLQARTNIDAISFGDLLISTSVVLGTDAAPNRTTLGTSVVIGEGAGNAFTNDTRSVVIGYQAAYSAHDLSGQGYNTVIGYEAGYGLTTGTENAFLGMYAGQAATTSANCVYIGSKSGRNIVGSFNVGIGYNALGDNTNAVTGIANVAIGSNAGFSLRNANSNVLIGGDAGKYLGTATTDLQYNNVAIGRYAMHSWTNGFGNVCIGYGAGWNGTGNNQLYIANSNTTTPLFYGNFATGEVTIHHRLIVKGSSAQLTNFLESQPYGTTTPNFAVTSSGSVGIGSIGTSPLAPLHVYAGSGLSFLHTVAQFDETDSPGAYGFRIKLNSSNGYYGFFARNNSVDATLPMLGFSRVTNAVSINGGTLGQFSVTAKDASTVGQTIILAETPTADAFQVLANDGTTKLFNITANCAIQLPTLADADAPNSSLYYSSTASKLAWKDAGGTVNVLY